MFAPSIYVETETATTKIKTKKPFWLKNKKRKEIEIQNTTASYNTFCTQSPSDVQRSSVLEDIQHEIIKLNTNRLRSNRKFTASLIIDNRENKNVDALEALSKLDKNIWNTKNLPKADLVFLINKKRVLLVERKALLDYKGSLFSGHLEKQKYDLSHLFDIPHGIRIHSLIFLEKRQVSDAQKTFQTDCPLHVEESKEGQNLSLVCNNDLQYLYEDESMYNQKGMLNRSQIVGGIVNRLVMHDIPTIVCESNLYSVYVILKILNKLENERDMEELWDKYYSHQPDWNIEMDQNTETNLSGQELINYIGSRELPKMTKTTTIQEHDLLFQTSREFIQSFLIHDGMTIDYACVLVAKFHTPIEWYTYVSVCTNNPQKMVDDLSQLKPLYNPEKGKRIGPSRVIKIYNFIFKTNYTVKAGKNKDKVIMIKQEEEEKEEHKLEKKDSKKRIKKSPLDSTCLDS